jgi:hypothetical protein
MSEADFALKNITTDKRQNKRRCEGNESLGGVWATRPFVQVTWGIRAPGRTVDRDGRATYRCLKVGILQMGDNDERRARA